MESMTEELDRELLARLETMESPDYKYPPRFNKNDWLWMAVCTAACLIATVALAAYCAAM